MTCRTTKYNNVTPVEIVQERNGVPPEYNKYQRDSYTFPVSPGELNKFRLRPKIVNEHAESSRTSQGVVASGLMVGQIFRASTDNITSLLLTLEPENPRTEIDNFESYADSAALVLQWATTGGTNDVVLETAITSSLSSSTKSMELNLNQNASEWTKTVSSVDLSAVVFELDYYQDVAYGDAEVSFFLGDGTNTKSVKMVNQAVNVWQHYDIPIAAFLEDGAGTTDGTAITKIGFRVDSNQGGAKSYVDNIEYQATPGTVRVKLWNMGANIPVSGTGTLASGTLYEKIGDAGSTGIQTGSYVLNLEAGKRLYHVDEFVAGVAREIPANEPLTASNYYALVLEHIDTNVNVFGPNTAYGINYYTNGYSFTTTANDAPLTGTGAFNDIMFGILSAQEVYMSRVQVRLNNPPSASANYAIYLEDENMHITDMVISHIHSPRQVEVFEFNKFPLLPVGGKLEVYYNDDPTDGVTTVVVDMDYIYTPPDSYR
jgi:hypothetical protein